MSETNGEKKGSGPIIPILCVVGGLAVGGAGMYFLAPALSGGGAPEEQTVAAEPDMPEGEPRDLLRVNVERFAAPMIDLDNRVLGYIWMDLSFEVDGPTNQSLLNARLPRVQSAMQRALHAAPTVDPDRPGALDLAGVEKRLRSAAHSAAGQDVIHRLYITNVQRAPN